MNLLYLTMYIAALLLFIIAAAVPPWPRVNLIAFGLACFTVPPVVQFATLVISGG